LPRVAGEKRMPSGALRVAHVVESVHPWRWLARRVEVGHELRQLYSVRSRDGLVLDGGVRVDHDLFELDGDRVVRVARRDRRYV
jgi:hypothetical protein